jgi:O-acetyl-ADP-ribose deacetylase (regulator of RNase III)
VLRFIRGNLLEADVDALVNSVNTVGVMGKGVALQFKRAYPENFEAYRRACENGELVTGRVFTVKLSRLERPKYIINFPTKEHWKGSSRLEYVEEGLRSLVHEIERFGIKSIAIPPLGCGLGGLAWRDVRSRIEAVLGGLLDVTIFVYEPAGKPVAEQMKTATSKPPMTLGRATVLGLMGRYLKAMMDDAVTLLELHKLTYFMQEAGADLRLEFVKGLYGPYAKNLHHVLEKIEGHYILGYGDGSEEPGKEIEPQRDAIAKAEAFMVQRPIAHQRFERVERLIDGFETAFGMELLGSVHWVAVHEQVPARTPTDAIHLIHDWNERKKYSFSSEHIVTAWNRLTEQSWLGGARFQLPLTYSDGRRVEPEFLTKIFRVLIVQFGGYAPLGITEGDWGGQTEPTMGIEVAVTPERIPDLRAVVHAIGKELGQKQMYFVAASIPSAGFIDVDKEDAEASDV